MSNVDPFYLSREWRALRAAALFPGLGPSAKTIAFGDFNNYFIRCVVGTQVKRLTERYADFNQVGFLAFQRWDGQLVDAGTHPIRYLQQSAT
jgi:HK97 family phage major capsid protein